MSPLRIPSSSLLWRLAAATAAGLLLWIAFPPVNDWVSGWFALVPLLFLARRSRPWQAFRWGWVTGMVFWLSSICWLLDLGRSYGNLPLVMLAWISLAAYCSLYIGLFAMAVSGLFHVVLPSLQRTQQDEDAAREHGLLCNLGVVLVIPLLWVGQEYLRSTLFTGFAWNALGISQYRNLAVIQVAAWGGVYAVSAVLMVVNSAIFLTAWSVGRTWRGARPMRMHLELTVGLMVCALTLLSGWRAIKAQRRGMQHESMRLRVAAIQPNIPQVRKWTLAFETSIYESLMREMDNVLPLAPDLIIWPETSLPGSARTDPESSSFARAMAERGSPILVGSIDSRPVGTGDAKNVYNVSFLFNGQGDIVQEYRKRHLVMFGEYMPFDSVLPFLRAWTPIGYSCTSGSTSTIFRVVAKHDPTHPVPFSSLICFEDTVAWLARRCVRNGARLLINQTNDAWFDQTAAPVQHLAHCVFRCVENRVSAVRCANSGITCHIEPTGRLHLLRNNDQLTRFSGSMNVSVSVRPNSMPLTFYTRFGDWPFAIPCTVLLGVVFVLVVKRERRENPTAATRETESG